MPLRVVKKNQKSNKKSRNIGETHNIIGVLKDFENISGNHRVGHQKDTIPNLYSYWGSHFDGDEVWGGIGRW